MCWVAPSFGAEGVQFGRGDRHGGYRKGAGCAAARSGARRPRRWRCRIDLTVQATIEEVLDAGMKMMNAKGAAAILMDVRTGEIVALASLARLSTRMTARQPLVDRADPGDSPLFNRAVQGVYELGSTFKIFAVAQAMELGLVNPETMVDANAPMHLGQVPDQGIRGQELWPAAVGRPM